MPLVQAKYRFLYLALFCTFVLFGTSATVVGAALPAILRDFHWNYGIAGLIMASGSLGNLLAIYVVGKIIGRTGSKAILVAGFLLEVVGLALFAVLPAALPNIILYCILGLGQGALEVGVNWTILRMDKGGSGRALSLMHGAFSIGAVLGPFLTGLLLAAQLPWLAVYRGIAVLFALLLVTVLALPLGQLQDDEAKAKAPKAKVGGAVRYLGLLALLFYVGVELGISNWVSEYFVKAFGYSVAAASFGVSIFWGGLALGRFGMPLVFRRARPGAVLLGFSVLLLLATTLLAALGSAGPGAAVLAALAVAAAGLGASCVYPSVITLVGAAYQAEPGPAIGLASAGGAVGSFVFPFAMSAIATAKGVQTGFIFYAGLAVLSLGSCAWLAARVTAKRP